MGSATFWNVAPCPWVGGARCLLAQAVLLGCGSTAVGRNFGATHLGDMNPPNSERRNKNEMENAGANGALKIAVSISKKLDIGRTATEAKKQETYKRTAVQQ